jgi:hypothetical protein
MVNDKSNAKQVKKTKTNKKIDNIENIDKELLGFAKKFKVKTYKTVNGKKIFLTETEIKNKILKAPNYNCCNSPFIQTKYRCCKK